MISINEIFRTYANEYLRRFPTLPFNHQKVIRAIVQCRSGAYGSVCYECQVCGHIHLVARSCGNRHCPGCQYHKTQQWLEKQLGKQLPGHHFMITFTIPSEIREMARKNQKIVYQALFKASSAAIKKLAKDKRFVGTDMPGFTGVLHTWGRQLQYHPHIHYIVAGGGLNEDRSEWIASRHDFFIPDILLSKIFRGIFMKEMKKAGLTVNIPKSVWKKDWVVDSEAVGSAEYTIKYLAPYIFRVAISNSRIIKVENRYVFFKFRKHGSKQYKTMKLEVMEFIRRYLQHVLPSGFMKVRHYGFMSPNCNIPFETIVHLVEKKTGSKLPPIAKTEIKSQYCPDCGGVLEYMMSFIPNRPFLE